MSGVYRAMLSDNGFPQVGRSAKELGVRVPGDITIVGNEEVLPNTGGMSVAPSWRQLPTHRIPKRLRHLAPDAAGKDSLHCWIFRDCAFVSGHFAANLALNVTRADHANVEPTQRTTLAAFEEHLASTRAGWEIDEP